MTAIVLTTMAITPLLGEVAEIASSACIGLLMLSAPVLAALFQYGEFSASDTHLASLSLMAYILGLPGFIMIKVLAPGYYARQDTRTPVRIAIIAMISNMVMNILFVAPLVLLEYEAPHVGLALATTCSAYINAIMLYRGLHSSKIFIPVPGWGKLLVQIALACSLMALLLWQITPALSTWSGWPAHERLLRLGLVIALAICAYFSVLWLSGVRPASLRRR